ncbi:hypothetical protein HDU76_007296 [Blyttiomyces sp. JEL0837]|nr:hypothetical protein HDU76_007296 [Blyttiomyces sp. JEL0837]
MGKKTLNPADAHRKLLRKRELKKNKDERKKVRMISSTGKETQKEGIQLWEELERLNGLTEMQSDKGMILRKQGIMDKLEQLNESRRQMGLPAVTKSMALGRKKVDAEEEHKWYHPTFNPHGPKRPSKDEEDSEEEDSDDDESDEDEEETEAQDVKAGNKEETSNPEKKEININELYDLSILPLPDGSAPMESQIYHNLDLPEIKSRPALRAQPQAVPQLDNRPPILQQFPHPQFPPQQFPPFQVTSQQFPPFQMQMPPMGYPPFQHQPPPQHFVPPPQQLFPPPNRPFHPYPPPHMNSRPMDIPAPNIPHIDVNATMAAAPVISAAPQLRDLQKELTTLVPAALRKRKAQGPLGGKIGAPASTKAVRSGVEKFVVNAAPDVAGEDGVNVGDTSWTPQVEKKASAPKTGTTSSVAGEYESFLKEIE